MMFRFPVLKKAIQRMNVSPAWLLLLFLSGALFCPAAETSKPYGLAVRPESKAYLSMPPLATGAFPPLLSQTGAFADTPRMVPGGGLIPYDVIVPFWSDGRKSPAGYPFPPVKKSNLHPPVNGLSPGAQSS